MKKKIELKWENDLVCYDCFMGRVYIMDGNEYVFYPFVDCDPALQNSVIKYLEETQPELCKDKNWFYNEFLPKYNVQLNTGCHNVSKKRVKAFLDEVNTYEERHEPEDDITYEQFEEYMLSMNESNNKIVYTFDDVKDILNIM